MSDGTRRDGGERGTGRTMPIVSTPIPSGRVRATLLPEGREAEVWIRDGLLQLDGPADAPLLAPPGGFALSGLVDSHSHLSWPHFPGMPSHTTPFMDGNRQIYAELGTTLLRDMGSDRDEVCGLADVPGLPPVRTSGTMLLRDDVWPLTDTPPERLRAAMLERLAKGASWVKVFADFSSDFQGRENPGFAGDDALTYPLELLRDAVDAVHAAGGRVAAHCYSPEGTRVSIDAGVDSLEHGWGLDASLLPALAAREIAWIPLVGIAGQMRELALRHHDPDKLRWIDERMAALQALLPQAVKAGVKVFAGTDWFPNPSVGDEILELHAFGLTATEALAAGAWAPRRWLGQPGLEAGARADLVLFRDDPRLRLDALLRPELVVIGGRRVTPHPERHLAPNRVRWSEATGRAVAVPS